MPLIVNGKEVKKIFKDNVEVLHMIDDKGKDIHKRVNLEFMIDATRPYVSTVDTWGTVADLPEDPVLENLPTIYLVGWSLDGVNKLPEPVRVPYDDSVFYAVWSESLKNDYTVSVLSDERVMINTGVNMSISEVISVGTDIKKGTDFSHGFINKIIDVYNDVIPTYYNVYHNISESVNLQSNLNKGIDFNLENVNRIISADETIEHHESNGTTFNYDIDIVNSILRGQDFSAGSVNSRVNYNDIISGSLGSVNRFNYISETSTDLDKGDDFTLSDTNSYVNVNSGVDWSVFNSVSINLGELVSRVSELFKGDDHTVQHISSGLETYSDSVSVMNSGNIISEEVTNKSLSLSRGVDYSISTNTKVNVDDNLNYGVFDAFNYSYVSDEYYADITRGEDHSSEIIKSVNVENIIKHSELQGKVFEYDVLLGDLTLSKGTDYSVSLDTDVDTFVNYSELLFESYNYSTSYEAGASIVKGDDHYQDVEYTNVEAISDLNNVIYNSVNISEEVTNESLTLSRGTDYSVSVNTKVNVDYEINVSTYTGVELSDEGTLNTSIKKGDDIVIELDKNIDVDNTLNSYTGSGETIDVGVVLGNIVYQKGEYISLDLDTSLNYNSSELTHLFTGIKQNEIIEGSIWEYSSSYAEFNNTETPTLVSLSCTDGEVNARIRNNDDETVTVYMRMSGGGWTALGTIDYGSSRSFNITYNATSNWNYSNLQIRAKAANKDYSESTSPTSGYVTCRFATLKWVYDPTGGGGFGIPQTSNPAGKACSIKGTYTSYFDPLTGKTSWYKCELVYE